MTDRFAVLVLAHHQPRVLTALLDSLRHPAIDVFVHVDAKSDLARFLAAAPERDGLTYLRDRREVRWGGLSIVSATLDLLAAARATGRPYRRFALLSGADLRIAPLDDVLTAWSGDTEYIRIDWHLTGPGAQRMHVVNRRHFPDDRFPVRGRWSGRIPRRVDETLPLVQGSTWWALTAEAVEHVHRFLAANPRWLRFHRHTLCADEIVFHSILAASPLADRIAQHVDRESDVDAYLLHPVHALHHIDWSDRNAINPRTFTIDDEVELRRSPALFARKADESSWELIDAFRAGEQVAS
ncbi:beta-1,6-N-acetylglucosaminyltransferase [Rhodococcus sp. NPDC003318]|uniref:beta-1,6-N-acetylglucosaminyltransferase n=1 Tax=Rhodococcus sp. NPDC003318 TaxID=3364503 RepID=UPI003682747E